MSATCAMPIPFPISRTSCISIQVTQTPAQQFLESTLTRWGTRLLRSHRLECPLPALCRFRFLYQEQAVYLYKLPKHRRNSFWNPRLPAGVHACSDLIDLNVRYLRYADSVSYIKNKLYIYTSYPNTGATVSGIHAYPLGYTPALNTIRTFLSASGVPAASVQREIGNAHVYFAIRIMIELGK